MTDIPAPVAADAEAEPGGRINGVIDVPRPGRVSGWAIDRADPDAAVIVRIAREGRLIGEVRADDHRPDLQRGGIGTGRYGFAIDLDEPCEPGFEFTIKAVALADDGTSGELRRVGRAKSAEDPGRRLAERGFEELCRLRASIGREPRSSDALLREAMERIEVIQARIETALSTVEPPQQSGTRGLAVAVAVSLLIGSVSLGLGLWSIFVG
jgi:hypothetical protein